MIPCEQRTGYVCGCGSAQYFSRTRSISTNKVLGKLHSIKSHVEDDWTHQTLITAWPHASSTFWPSEVGLSTSFHCHHGFSNLACSHLVRINCFCFASANIYIYKIHKKEIISCSFQQIFYQNFFKVLFSKENSSKFFTTTHCIYVSLLMRRGRKIWARNSRIWTFSHNCQSSVKIGKAWESKTEIVTSYESDDVRTIK